VLEQFLNLRLWLLGFLPQSRQDKQVVHPNNDPRSLAVTFTKIDAVTDGRLVGGFAVVLAILFTVGVFRIQPID
jgi:hypothetical protein